MLIGCTHNQSALARAPVVMLSGGGFFVSFSFTRKLISAVQLWYAECFPLVSVVRNSEIIYMVCG